MFVLFPVFPEQRALLGSFADLPCNVTHRPDDRLQMLLFYKRNESDVSPSFSSRPDYGRTLATGPPMFTLDMRGAVHRVLKRSHKSIDKEKSNVTQSELTSSDDTTSNLFSSFSSSHLLKTPEIDEQSDQPDNGQFVASAYAGRVTFNLSRADGLFVLRVRGLSEQDAGQYICRADFKWTRTLISIVTLYVVGKL